MKSLPPDPGVGYRLLKPARGKFRGELIQYGDEFLLAGNWFASTQEGDRQGKIGKAPHGHPWRRRRTDEPIPAVEAVADTAKKIVEELFTGGSTGKAGRLVLERHGQHHSGEGWCSSAAYDRILAILSGRPMR